MSSPAERVAAQQDDRPGCWNLAYVEWGRVFVCFACLWATLALLFWAFMEIGIAVRGTQYLVMEDRFFGPFERSLVPVVYTNDVTGKSALVNTFNRPAGCEGDFASGYTCDSSTNPSWTLAPETSDPAWSAVLTGCASANTTVLFPASDTGAGVYTGWCLNVLPVNEFVTGVSPQPYPTYGLTS